MASWERQRHPPGALRSSTATYGEGTSLTCRPALRLLLSLWDPPCTCQRVKRLCSPQTTGLCLCPWDFLHPCMCVRTHMCVCVCACDPHPTPPPPVTDARLFMCKVWECCVGRWADMHVFVSACVKVCVCVCACGLRSGVMWETALVRMCRHACECICILRHMCVHVSVPAHTLSKCVRSQLRTSYQIYKPLKLLSHNPGVTDGGAAGAATAALVAKQMMS